MFTMNKALYCPAAVAQLLHSGIGKRLLMLYLHCTAPGLYTHRPRCCKYNQTRVPLFAACFSCHRVRHKASSTRGLFANNYTAWRGLYVTK